MKIPAFQICIAASLIGVAGFSSAAESDVPKGDTKVKQNISHAIQGAWVLAGQPGGNAEPKPGARVLFLGPRHWAITEANPATGEVIFHHGGTYKLDGNKYSEEIKYATVNTKDMIGMKFKFELKVDGDTLIKKGLGNPFNEQWKRLKAE